jgi:hypothetical protein
VSQPGPDEDELAAIAAALVFARRAAEPAMQSASGWVLAARYPDLEFDELLALRQPCSTRF